MVSPHLGSLLGLKAVGYGMKIHVVLGKLLPPSYKSMLLPAGKGKMTLPCYHYPHLMHVAAEVSLPHPVEKPRVNVGAFSV